MHENTNHHNGSLISWALNGSPAAFRSVVSGLLLLGLIALLAGV